jgi:ribose-phosphate pyrophosphokinase
LGGQVANEDREFEIDLVGNGLAGLKVFSGSAHPELAAKVAGCLGIELGKLTATKFSDGEIRVIIEESARGNDIFIIQPTCNPTNDNLLELFIMLDAFRRASASRMTVVMPYYGYARQDKKVKPREPITARLIADIMEGCGASRVVTLDLHADQIQGFFSVPVDHLYGGPILANYFIEKGYRDLEDLVVVSPDVAGVTRARALSERLNCPFAVIAKRRPAPNEVEVVEIVGDFVGRRCIMIDDIIDTGGSIVAGAEALMRRGAKSVTACCSHAIFSRDACEKLESSCIEQVVALDTIPILQEKCFPKLTILSCAPLLADAMRRIFRNESVSELFQDWK